MKHRPAVLVLLALALTLTVSACGETDVKMKCRDGLAFAVSDDTRGGIVRVPEWDDRCHDNK